MKIIEKFVSYLILVVIIIVGLRFVPALPISSIVTQKQSDFIVSGTGKVTAVPDMAIITLGVRISKPTIKSAKDEVNATINKTLAALEKLGIDAKDIKTQNYSVDPDYDWNSGRNKITGYSVSEDLLVKVRDLDKINDVIDQTAALGLNNIGNISLTVNDDKLKELQTEARKEAVKEAKAKAESLAGAAGMTLGKIINVTESEPWTPRPMMMAAKDLAVTGAGESTNIQAGSTDITSTVTLTYETR